MNDNPITFREHIGNLSPYLRKKYNLSISERSDSDIDLANDHVILRFCKGNIREPYVALSISYKDPSILGETKWILIEDYISYLKAWEMYFPSSIDVGESHSIYSSIGSSYQVLELIIFLGALGKPLIEGDQKVIQKFIHWMFERNRNYSEKMSKGN